jgi:hypothetical protein
LYRQAGEWAWIVPTSILVFRMRSYSDGFASVLLHRRTSALAYFFDPHNILDNEPERIVALMLITAPFVAGIAYSVGAICASLLEKNRRVA